MKFMRGFWKILVGVKDGLVLLLLLLFFAALYFALSATPHAGGLTRGALTLNLDGPIVEQPAEITAMDVVGGGPLPREYRLAQLVHTLETAARDPGIEAVALDLDIFAGGHQAAISNVGEAIRKVRAEGKRVVAYATAYDDDGYQLAAQADEIWLNPMGAVLITGPGGNNLYFAELMEKLGITANVYRVGAFKSAVEPFTRSDMSPEAREASRALAGALWQQWLDEVGRARPDAQVAAYAADPAGLVERNRGDMAQTALTLGLVDHVGDRSAFRARMAELVGAGDDGLPNSFRAVDYDNFAARNPLNVTGGEIGILTIAGEIVDGEAAPGTAGAETIVRALDRGLANNDIEALVVRIDSPGGSVLASERIRQAILAVRAQGIPVVASMGSVAASGGYWIAAAADRIYAEPATITGSIGVFGILPSFEEALGDIGVGVDGVKTTPLSGEPDLLKGPSEAADRMLQMGVETTYRRFLGLVSEARGLPVERVHQIAQGRVWDGGTARQLGLVDQFGDLQDAVNDAGKRAELSPATARAVYLEPERSWVSELFGEFGTVRATVSPDPFTRIAQRPAALLQRAIGDVRALIGGPAIQARCLECPPAYDSAPALPSTASWWQALLGPLAGR